MRNYFIIYFSLVLALSSSLLISMQKESADSSEIPIVDLTNENDTTQDLSQQIQEQQKCRNVLDALVKFGSSQLIERPLSPRTKKANEIICYVNQYKFSRNASEQTSEEMSPGIYLSLAQAGIAELLLLERNHKTKK